MKGVDMSEMYDNKEFYETILDNLWIGVWTVDRDGNFTFINKNMEKIAGLSKEKAIGTSLMKNLSKRAIGDEGHFKELFLRAKDSLEPAPYEAFPIISPDGDLVYQSGFLIPLVDGNGNYYGMMGTVEDVTKKELREAAERKAVETEKRLEAIYKNSPVVAFLWTAEKDWPIEYVSDNIRQFGYTPEDFTSGRLIYGDIIHPDDLHMVRNEVSKIEVGGQSYFTKEYRLVTKDEEIRWVLERSMLGRTEKGEPSYYQGIVIDITDRKRVEEALQEYADELAKANEDLKSLDKMKDEFLSNVSHELKTPLVSIKGYGELLYDGTLGPTNGDQDKALKTVLRNAERLRKLVDSLLFLSRTQMDRMEYVFEDVHVFDVVEDSISDMILQINKKDLELEKNVPDDLPEIKGDRGKLTDMLTNLLDNAIKFTPEGGKITISALEEDEDLHLIVTDTGIGIKKELIPNLFQRFYQIDASIRRKYGGTGLGLYICKKIVEAHKGKIWVESEEGQGTTVHITLPK